MCQAQLVAALRSDVTGLRLRFSSTPEKLQQKRSVTFPPPTRPPSSLWRPKNNGPARRIHSQSDTFSSLLQQVGGDGEKTIFSMAARAVSSHRREVTPAIHHHYRFPRKLRRWGEREKKEVGIMKFPLAHFALEQPVMKSQSSLSEQK